MTERKRERVREREILTLAIHNSIIKCPRSVVKFISC